MPNHAERVAFRDRVREIRFAVYGDDGVPRVAEALGVSEGTWRNYESGVMMPDLVLLRFVCLTRTDPQWLLTGEGSPYSRLAGSDGHQATN